ncbi:iron-containing alcohol dehydrogenase, partial [Vibrio astriarenae]
DLPSHITAATGMDALSHSLEAFCAPSYHPMADGIALESMHLIKRYLYKAYIDGHDIDARTQLLVASCMGATAFQKGLGAMHALAHTLGGLYDKHHGLLNAILMPYVL